MTRSFWSSVLACVLLLTAGAVVPTSTAAADSGATVAPVARAALTAAQFETRLLALTNARRKAVGCVTLKSQAALTRAARAHSRRMASANKLSHQLPGEPGLARRIENAGYKRWAAAAENIAWGTASPQGIFAMWMRSPGHRGNIQRCTYRDAGVGVVLRNGTPWVTLDLGRRR